MTREGQKVQWAMEGSLRLATNRLSKEAYKHANENWRVVPSVDDLQRSFNANRKHPDAPYQGRLTAAGLDIHRGVPEHLQERLGIAVDVARCPGLIMHVDIHREGLAFPDSFHSVLNRLIPEEPRAFETWLKRQTGGVLTKATVKAALEEAYKSAFRMENGIIDRDPNLPAGDKPAMKWSDAEIKSVIDTMNAWIDDHVPETP